MRLARLLSTVSLTALGACSGDLVFPFLFPDTGDASTTDAGDTGASSDAAVRDTSAELTADGGCGCRDTELCVDGVCVCPEGTLQTERGCLELPPSDTDPATRTVEQLCTRWTADYPERATRIYTRGDTACAPGAIDPTAHEDAVRRLNLFRWLVGLEPAGVNERNAELAQYAAVMFAVNDALSHTPPTSWECYTAQGAQAAGSSNIAWGYGSAAETVDGYVGDTGVDSLGHRRWCLYPQLDDTGFGHHDDGGAMWAFGSASRRSPDFVAYPPPGPVPVGAIMGEWSFSTDDALGGASIGVEDVTSGQSLRVSQQLKDSGYGQETIGYTIGATPSAGDVYQISVTVGGRVTRYRTEFVDCP